MQTTSNVHGRLRRVGALVVVVLAALFGLAAPAVASTTQPFDPSPYCRPVVDLPYTSGPVADGIGFYQFTATVIVHLNCNGSVYNESITAILHYQTKEDGVTYEDNAASGASHSCSGSCTASAQHVRVKLHCGEVYNYNDYGQITGFWQKTSTSSRTNISVTGAHTIGSSFEPVPPC